MKTVIQIVLWLLCLFFAYQIYNSVTGPIAFKKTKTTRYTDVIERMKVIRDAQDAHRTVTGKFSNSFDDLIKFVDTAQFTITQQRDSSYTEYDPVYRIDMVKEVKVIDTLGFAKVKDSLFKNSDAYKEMMFIPHGQNNEKFTLKTDILDNNGFKTSVFEVRAPKDVILHDLDESLRSQENEMISVDEVNGNEIILGSLTDVSTNGNWPTIYDTKKAQ